MTDNNQDDKKDMTIEEALEEINASHIALDAAVKSCEDCRQFMAVARQAIKSGNPDLAKSILTVIIERLDPFLQNYYKNIPDEEFIDIVKEKMENTGPWPEERVDFVELDDSLENLVKDNNEENKKN